MSNPLVSIILRTYKRSHKLKDCIDNIIAQDYLNWELIIVDDNGLESEYAGEAKIIANSYQNIKQPILIYEHKKNLGLCAAGNTGIDFSNGEYIAFIDDDDIWHPEKLKIQIKNISESDVGIVICGLNYIDIEKNSQKSISFNLGEDLFKSILKKGSGINTSTLLFKKKILKEIKGFDRNKLCSYTDFDLLIRASQICKHKEIKRSLVNYYVDNNGISRNYKAKFEGKKIVLKRYKHFYKQYNLMYFYSNHLEVLADYALLQNNIKPAIKYYLKSIKINPFVLKRFVKLLFCFLGGKKLYVYYLNNRDK